MQDQFKINMHRESYKTVIIILNWNGLNDTIECLHSIQEFCIDEDFLVVLVDNKSTQPIDPLFQIDWKIPILIYKNTENSGFAEGNNIGVRVASPYKPEFVFLLNNDTVLLDNLLDKMVAAFRQDEKVGVVGAVNYYFSEPGVVWQAGAIVSTKTGGIRQLTVDESVESVRADYVPGSSIMVRAEIVDQIGLFDPNFFAYSEELDFCLRAKNLGYEVIFLTDAKILHKVGKSSPKPAKEYLRLRNKFYLFKRHSTPLNFFLISVKETAKATAKATIELFKKGTPVYYVAIYYAIRDYRKQKMGFGAVDKFL